jgi:hypothetical protein
MMRVFYGMAKGNARRYQCRGDDAHVGAGLCIGIGGVRIDRAVALQILEAVSDRAVEAAIFASDQVERSRKEVVAAVERELEGARYDASLASRRYDLGHALQRAVPARLELTSDMTLGGIHKFERRIEDLRGESEDRPCAPPPACPRSAGGLECAFDRHAHSKQRLIHILVQEIVCELDDDANEAVLLIHWTGGRHTEGPRPSS